MFEDMSVSVDCCDGSDEYDGYTTCENTCKQDHQVWRYKLFFPITFSTENAARMEEFSKGTETLRQWIEQSKLHFESVEKSKIDLQLEIDDLSNRIELMKTDISLLELEISSSSANSAVDSDGNKLTRDDRLKSVYQRLGLQDLNESELRLLIIHMLSHGVDYTKTPFERFPDDLHAVNSSIAVDLETSSEKELKEILEMPVTVAPNEKLGEMKNELGGLEDEKKEKEKKMEDLKKEMYFGPMNEFFVMKGQCYSEKVQNQ